MYESIYLLGLKLPKGTDLFGNFICWKKWCLHIEKMLIKGYNMKDLKGLMREEFICQQKIEVCGY